MYKSILIIFVLLLGAMGSAPLLAGKSEEVASQYVLWKKTKFHRFFINDDVDFSKYKKMAFLPMDYSELQIAKKTKKKLERNWSNFKNAEMPGIAERFDVDVKDILGNSEDFEPTEKAGEDVLIVAFKALEVIPKAYLDNGLSTVGTQTLSLVGYLTYQVVMLDGASREIVAMIEDDHTIAPNTLATGEQNNTLGNHRRAWSLSMKNWVQRFLKDLETLQKKH